MARYFLDTAPVVGLTFLHDLWREDAERLFDTDNLLFLTRAVVYEYCNSTQSNSLETASVDWDTDAGLFGDKLSKVRIAQTNLDLKLRVVNDAELDLPKLLDMFLEETGLDEEIKPERLLDERIRPALEAFLNEEIGGREITAQVAREAMDALCDTIQAEARDTRDEIEKRVEWVPDSDIDHDGLYDRLNFIGKHEDQVIVADAGSLCQDGVLDRLISADKGDIYSNHERIKALTGVQVLYIKDKFAENPINSL